MIVRNSLMTLLTITIAIPILGQQPSEEQIETHRAHMEQVHFLEGEWVGEGWFSTGPEQRQTFRSRESVVKRLDGMVLIIEGVHESLEKETKGEVVHHALAILSWDPDAEIYRFRSHMANGRGGDFTGTIVDGAFVWTIEHPRGTIRYTIRLTDDGHWSEIGERSADGETWSPFFGMELERAGD